MSKDNTYDPVSGTWVDEGGHTDKNDPRNSMAPIPQPDESDKPAPASYQAIKADTKKSK